MNEIYTAYYLNNDYRLYLMHHGVKGQKWGVRRYQNYDGSLTSAGEKHISGDGTGFRARMRIRREGRKNTRQEILQNVKNAKGIVNKASELVGHGASATKARNRSFTEKRLANASKTKFGKNLHNVRSENINSFAQYHDIKRGQSLGRRILEGTTVNGTLMNMPMKTLGGRKTTVGKYVITDALTGGLGNIALDAAYRHSKKHGGNYAKASDRVNSGFKTGHAAAGQKALSNIEKRSAAKDAYKQRNEKIQNQYDKTEAKIESKYGKGQKMSDKDVAALRDADTKARKAWADSKARYKADKKKYKNRFMI